MMDLGAMVCLPNGAPKCEVCPLFDQCLAGQHQTWTEYPFKKSAKPRRIEDRTVLLFLDGTHTAVRKRPKKDFWRDLRVPELRWRALRTGST